VKKIIAVNRKEGFREEIYPWAVRGAIPQKPGFLSFDEISLTAKKKQGFWALLLK